LRHILRLRYRQHRRTLYQTPVWGKIPAVTPSEVLIAAAIGLLAGLVGGLCGIGGSIIMLPGLALAFGYDDEANTRHHLYMASAMLVNVVVAAMAIWPHVRARAIDRRVVVRLMPPMAAAIIGGVMLGDQVSGSIPKLVLVVFLFMFVAWTLFTAIRKLPEPAPEQERATTARLGTIGIVTGLLAGFLAIGGGIVMVPAMQLAAKLPLRRAIAASAAAMCLASPIGAAMKFSSLPEHTDALGQPLSRGSALALGVAMAAGAAIGSPLGARLTHKLRLPHLRLAVAVVLGLSAAKMAGFF
jgi:uncharacterized membrane protein YfcA